MADFIVHNVGAILGASGLAFLGGYHIAKRLRTAPPPSREEAEEVARQLIAEEERKRKGVKGESSSVKAKDRKAARRTRVDSDAAASGTDGEAIGSTASASESEPQPQITRDRESNDSDLLLLANIAKPKVVGVQPVKAQAATTATPKHAQSPPGEPGGSKSVPSLTSPSTKLPTPKASQSTAPVVKQAVTDDIPIRSSSAVKGPTVSEPTAQKNASSVPKDIPPTTSATTREGTSASVTATVGESKHPTGSDRGRTPSPAKPSSSSDAAILARIAALEKQLDTLTSSNTVLTAQLTQASGQAERAKADVKILRESNTQLQAALAAKVEQLRIANEVASSKSTDAASKSDETKIQLERAAEDTAMWKRKAQEQHEEAERWKVEAGQWESRFEGKVAEVQHATHQSTLAVSRLNELAATHAMTSAQSAQLAAQLDRAHSQIAAQAGEIAQLRSHMEAEIGRARAEREGDVGVLKAKLDASEAERKALGEDHKALKELAGGYEASSKAADAALDDARREVEEERERRVALQHELLMEKTKIEEMKTLADSLADRVKEAEERVAATHTETARNLEAQSPAAVTAALVPDAADVARVAELEKLLAVAKARAIELDCALTEEQAAKERGFVELELIKTTLFETEDRVRALESAAEDPAMVQNIVVPSPRSEDLLEGLARADEGQGATSKYLAQVVEDLWSTKSALWGLTEKVAKVEKERDSLKAAVTAATVAPVVVKQDVKNDAEAFVNAVEAHEWATQYIGQLAEDLRSAKEGAIAAREKLRESQKELDELKKASVDKASGVSVATSPVRALVNGDHSDKPVSPTSTELAALASQLASSRLEIDQLRGKLESVGPVYERLEEAKATLADAQRAAGVAQDRAIKAEEKLRLERSKIELQGRGAAPAREEVMRAAEEIAKGQKELAGAVEKLVSVRGITGQVLNGDAERKTPTPVNESVAMFAAQESGIAKFLENVVEELAVAKRRIGVLQSESISETQSSAQPDVSTSNALANKVTQLEQILAHQQDAHIEYTRYFATVVSSLEGRFAESSEASKRTKPEIKIPSSGSTTTTSTSVATSPVHTSNKMSLALPTTRETGQGTPEVRVTDAGSETEGVELTETGTGSGTVGTAEMAAGTVGTAEMAAGTDGLVSRGDGTLTPDSIENGDIVGVGTD
ncbi:hypothetical protein HDU93_005959 [Gonapodya sp. JEL0774]|nr:hypothetical protein HDU93_005959 [Gonapodya sp. JEL0774]